MLLCAIVVNNRKEVIQCLIAHAENLGYDYCWATDSHLIRSNPGAVLALAAQQTRTIKLGTGLAIGGCPSPSNFRWDRKGSRQPRLLPAKTIQIRATDGRN